MKEKTFKKKFSLEFSKSEIKSIIDRMAEYEFNQLLLIELIKYEFIVNSRYKDNFLELSIHEQTLFVKSIIFILKKNSYMANSNESGNEMYDFEYNSLWAKLKKKEIRELNKNANTSRKLNLNLWNRICTYKNIDINGIFSFTFNYIWKFIYDKRFRNYKHYFFEGEIMFRHLASSLSF
ncbi:MAG: hypothetical protein ACD_3C00054G0033 [uncultured bacterium (gcode 4)]|uniref:Uncharacterized protein n=1 Tax=uncultured bacterium (gcode 4) TaxID=1234023 RepID=K2FZW2_9BACT|nr:MAG: hypothetical protein ACD_3C00054G0033 [uncultured bacterium (gcode 4)]